MFLDTFPDMFRIGKRNDYLDEDIPDEDDTNATPASPIPSQPSRSSSSSPSPLANKSYAPPQNSKSGWDMCKTMCVAGGTGLEQVIAAADDAMPQAGLSNTWKHLILFWIILNTSNVSNFSSFCAEWLLECRSRIVYERKQNNQVFYVLPVEYILGKLPVVPVGDTGTIPYSMRQHAKDFVGAAFDTRVGAGDGSRWWYVNTWVLSWSRERGEKGRNLPPCLPVL
jgi:hypothetical protein